MLCLMCAFRIQILVCLSGKQQQRGCMDGSSAVVVAKIKQKETKRANDENVALTTT